MRIDVYDTGVGIPESKQRDIFIEFHRLDQGAKIARGLGLGLSIVERVARVLGGEVEVGLEGRARLAFFRHGAAVRTRCRSNCRRATTPGVDPGQLAGTTALCIDNEPAVLDGMETLLRGWGCEVIKAPDLDVALAAIAESATHAERAAGRLPSR